MKKRLFFGMIAILISGNLFAQDKRTSEFGVDKRTNELTFGADFAFPTGDFFNYYERGVGGVLQYQYGITEMKKLLISVGYIGFSGTVPPLGINPAVDVKASYVPVKGGLKFKFFKMAYFTAEIGVAIPVSETLDGLDDFRAEPYRTAFKFAYSPGIGVDIPVGNGFVDLGGRYEGWGGQGSATFFGLHAAYSFTVKRR